MFQTNDTSRHSIEEFKSFNRVQKVYRRAENITEIGRFSSTSEIKSKAVLVLLSSLKSSLKLRVGYFLKNLIRVSQCESFKELRAITLQQTIITLLKR